MNAAAPSFTTDELEVRTVAVDSLTVDQLRALPLMNGWLPDAGGQDPKPMMVAAARNRYGDRVPASLLQESA